MTRALDGYAPATPVARVKNLSDKLRRLFG